MALGGVLQSHGSDWTNGTMHIDAGGSHESNPYEGIQIGKDASGTPNLVEEGERIFNDYVYSKRIFADGGTLEKFHLSKKRKISFADLAELLEKEASERPNDPISQAALQTQMADLADEQERQKQEMEAAKAQAAFESLTPEEKVGIMQYAQQQDQMAQEQAMQEEAMAQQVSPEEAAMMQQGVPTADAMGTVATSQPEVLEGQPVMACGGKMHADGGNLYPWGGYENLFNVTPPYAASNTTGYIPYTRDLTEDEVLRREKEQRFIDWTNYVNSNWDSDYVQNYLRALDAAAGGNHLFDAEGKLLPKAKDYYNHARTGNHKWGYYHLTPEQVAANRIFHAVEGDDDYLPDDQSKWVNVGAENRRVQLPNGDVVIYHNSGNASGRVFHAIDGEGEYLEGDPSTWNGVGAEVRRETLPNGDTVVYHAAGAGSGNDSTNGKVVGTGNGSDEYDVVPIHKNDKWRYAGLFGPAVGLGMQALGIGRPDTKALNGILEGYDRRGASYADYKPIGNYLRYVPMDVWAAQNRMDANTRASERILMNTTSPSKWANVIANNYASQLGNGELHRQSLEYNDANALKKGEFNRGTDMFNAQAYNQTSQFNASQRERDRQLRAQLGMQAAAQKADMDAGWYNGIYGNVAGLFEGIGDLGRENAQHNMIADMAATGIFGTLKNQPIANGYIKVVPKKNETAKGGKVNRKKGKRGLTF